MTLPKTILVATDFTEPSDAALAYAVALARKLDAQVHVVHAYELPVIGFPDGVLTITAEMASGIISAAEKALRDIVEKHAASGFTLTTSLEQADARDGILIAAKKVAADLIVMGTHGRRGISRALIGSVAENVIRRATLPVLTIHTESVSGT